MINLMLLRSNLITVSIVTLMRKKTQLQLKELHPLQTLKVLIT